MINIPGDWLPPFKVAGMCNGQSRIVGSNGKKLVNGLSFDVAWLFVKLLNDKYPVTCVEAPRGPVSFSTNPAMDW